MHIRIGFCLAAFMVLSLGVFQAQASAPEPGALAVYTTRTSEADAAAFAAFTKQTGIKVDVVAGKSSELVKQLEAERDTPIADIFISVDGGVLDAVKRKGLLQPVTDARILEQVPAALRDTDNHWVGLTTRARVIVYAKDRVTPEQLSTYEDLADPKWKGKVVMRPGPALYNVSLMATLIELDGEQVAAEWVKGVVANFAREPKGGDRGQAKDIAAGKADLTLMNTYYIGRMLNGKDEAEKKVAESVGVFFPNQTTTGTHINICGIGVTAKAPNREAAEKFIAFLTDTGAQSQLSAGNYEYPVNPKAKKAVLLESWGPFKAQAVDFAVMNTNNTKAKTLLAEGGWDGE